MCKSCGMPGYHLPKTEYTLCTNFVFYTSAVMLPTTAALYAQNCTKLLHYHIHRHIQPITAVTKYLYSLSTSLIRNHDMYMDNYIKNCVER